MILSALALPLFAATVVPPKQVQTRVKPVFLAFARVVDEETEQSAAALELALSRVLEDRSAVGDESLAILLGFYLGEHPGEDISCELVARGRKVVPLLEKYRSASIRLREVGHAALQPDKAKYDGVIARIKAGDGCVREP